MEAVLSVQSINKHYPGFALENVSFSLAPNRIMGLIGKNGAGKSTTLKAILNMVCQKVGASMDEDEAHKAHIQYTFNILIWQTRINGISEYTEATMKIAEVKDRKPDFINRLVEVWENSVRATHF